MNIILHPVHGESGDEAFYPFSYKG